MIFHRSRSKSLRWKRRNTFRLLKRARKVLSFTRKHMTERFMISCIWPDQKRILAGAWHVPSEATTPVFVALELARFLGWLGGARKRLGWPRISNICLNAAGNLPSP